MRFWSAMLVFSLVSAFFANSAGAQEDLLEQRLAKIAASGRAAFEAAMAELGEFDEEQVRVEGQESYKIFKIGERVEIRTRTRVGVHKGTLQSIDSRSVLIGSTRVPIDDIIPEDQAKLSEEKSKEMVDRHVAAARRNHMAERIREEMRVIKEIEEKYPAIPENIVRQLFSEIEGEDRRTELSDTFLDAYNEALPLAVGRERREFLAEIIQQFTAASDSLIYTDQKFHCLREQEERERRGAEAIARRGERQREAVARDAERHLRPRAAIPILSPDGGDFLPGGEIAISCATPGAAIHYTTDGIDPDEDSPLYERPFRLRRPATVKVKAFHPVFRDSPVNVIGEWDETGLFASYFGRMDFRGTTMGRVEKVPHIMWEGPPPLEEIPADLFSIIVAGRLVPPRTGTYTFYFTADDAGRFWIADGDRVVSFINAWKEQAPTEYTGKPVNLIGGREYEIKACIVELYGKTHMVLDWEGPGISKQNIPTEFLRSYGRYTNQLLRWNEVDQSGRHINRRRMNNPGGDGLTVTVPMGKGSRERFEKDNPDYFKFED